MLHFVSDSHFGHENILRYTNRPFATVPDMNEALIANHNHRVSSEDTCYFVGDVAMGQRNKTLAEVLPRLNGKKILICGNHDYCHMSNKKQAEWLPTYAKYFDEIHQKLELDLKIGKFEKVRMYHFPYKGAAYEDHEVDDIRYAALRLDDDGMLLLHGHTHQKEAKTGPNSLHVGIDCIEWGWGPASLEQLDEYVRENY